MIKRPLVGRRGMNSSGAGRRSEADRSGPWSSSSLKNSSLSLAEWDFFISAIRFRGTLRLRDGEKKEGRFLSGVGGVLKDVTCPGKPVRDTS